MPGLPYGLIKIDIQGASPLHNQKYEITLMQEFRFDKACCWDKEEYKTQSDVKYGNITIAKLENETYWLLITTGIHAGKVWLLTKKGITPIRKNFRLNDLENLYWKKSKQDKE